MKRVTIALIALAGLPAQGCAVLGLGAAAGAGAVAAEEAREQRVCDDDKFDPLEKQRGKEDECN